MSFVTAEEIDLENVSDLIDRLGGIPLNRIPLRPPLGTATETDLLTYSRRKGRLYELVEGTLVEKAMGYAESFLAGTILMILRQFVDPRNLGLVTGPDGTVRLFPGLVRIPDVAFASWDRIPNRRLPKQPIPDLIPDLSVEVLSTGNTKAEMAKKCQEYFAAGVRLVWLVDPLKKSVEVHTGADDFVVIDETGTLDGGDVLPGLSFPLATLFAELDRTG